MGIETAKQKILTALNTLQIDCVDDAKTIRPEGLLLSFERMICSDFSTSEYVFGLYLSKKVLNRKSESLYNEMDTIKELIIDEAKKGVRGDEISLSSISFVGFDNGILEYRIEIHVKEI